MRQKLGQHFLKNRDAIGKIISALDPRDETIVEIGSGKGALTIPLAAKCEKTNCNIVAIEKDPTLAAEAKSWDIKDLDIMGGDVLEILPELSSKLRNGKYKLVGNIPYYLTGFLLRKLSELKNKPSLTVFTIQKEVAERIVAEPPKMNRLAAAVQFWAEPKIVSIISRKDFNPMPDVDSAIISLKTLQPKAGGMENRYYQTLSLLFQQPRKTILNNLSAKNKKNRKEALSEIANVLAELGIDPSLRPQDLSIDNIISVADKLGQLSP